MSNSAGVDSVEKLRIGEGEMRIGGGEMRTGALSSSFVVVLLLAGATETHWRRKGHEQCVSPRPSRAGPPAVINLRCLNHTGMNCLECDTFAMLQWILTSHKVSSYHKICSLLIHQENGNRKVFLLQNPSLESVPSRLSVRVEHPR